MLFTLLLSLDSSIVNFANLFRIKKFPFFAMKIIVKVLYIRNCTKINKCIAHVTVIVKIDGQIKKVKFSFEFFVDRQQHLFLGILVGNVSDHQGRPLPFLYLAYLYLEIFVIFHFILFSPRFFLWEYIFGCLAIVLILLKLFGSFLFLKLLCQYLYLKLVLIFSFLSR